jgi:GGDEF domain-containing protein
MEKPQPFKLSLSIGFARYDPLSPCSIEEILDRADKNMYEQKQMGRTFQLNNRCLLKTWKS